LATAVFAISIASLATHEWITFTFPQPPSNPITTVSGTTVSYFIKNFGLWVGCIVNAEVEIGSQPASCSTITWNCNLSNCFRNRNTGQLLCLSIPIFPAKLACGSFNATRILAVIGGVVTMFGFVALCAAFIRISRRFLGAISMCIGSFLLMIPFAVFYADVYVGTGNNYSDYGYSLALFIAAWVLALFSGIFALIAPKIGMHKREHEHSQNYDQQPDYEQPQAEY